MASDCSVRFRTEEEIAEFAGKVRKLVDIHDIERIDIVDAVQKFEGKVFNSKGTLNVNVFEDPAIVESAFVTFDPLTMHIEEETWRHAIMGDEESRYIIAHELGHVVLHDKTAKKFSSKFDRYHVFGMDEHSAEWQANTFADYLLVPDEMALTFNPPLELAYYAGIPSHRAIERLGSVSRRKLNRAHRFAYSEDSCVECGNLSMVRRGISSRCEICKKEC